MPAAFDRRCALFRRCIIDVSDGEACESSEYIVNVATACVFDRECVGLVSIAAVTGLLV